MDPAKRVYRCIWMNNFSINSRRDIFHNGRKHVRRDPESKDHLFCGGE